MRKKKRVGRLKRHKLAVICSDAVAASLLPALEDFPDIATAVQFDPATNHERTEFEAFDLIVVVVEARMTTSIQVALTLQSLVIARPTRLPSMMAGAALDEVNTVLNGREVSSFEKPTDVCASVRRWLEARRVGLPTSVEIAQGTPLATERAAARLLFAAGQLAAAAASYEDIIQEAERRKLQPDLHTARLGLALCLLALDRHDEARNIARTLKTEHIAKPAYLTTIRALTALELSDEAAPFIAALDPNEDRELLAFNAMLANAVPEAVPETSDLVMQGVALLTQEHRFGTAARWLETCLEKIRGNTLLAVFYIERVASLLEEWCWNLPGDDPLTGTSITRLLKETSALAASIDRIGLAKIITTRLVRAELGIASRTYDEPRANELAVKLDVLAGPPPEEQFVIALRTAMRGELDKAMTLLAAVQPEWRGRMQRLSLSFLAGQAAESIEGLQELAFEYPDVPIIQGELARRLVELDRNRDAVASARQSYRLLPGIGQTMFLAHTLITSGASDEAEALLRTSESNDPRIAGLLAQAIENRQLPESLEYWDRYLDAYPSDWATQLRVINLMTRANRLDTARDRSWSLVEKHPIDAPPELFFEAAVLQDAFGTEPERTARIQRLWKSLDKRAESDPNANRMRLLIWLRLNANVPLPKPDLARIPEGAVVSLEGPEVRQLLEASAQQANLVRHLYDRGHISVLCAFPIISEDPAHYIFSLGRNNYLPAGESSWVDAPTLAADDCVRLGVLEILALVRLDLLGELEARLNAGLRVYVFEDVIDSLSRMLLARSLQHADARREDAKRLLVAATSGAFAETEDSTSTTWIGSVSERVALLRRLKERGAISSRMFTRLVSDLSNAEIDDEQRASDDASGVTVHTLRWLLDNHLVDIASLADEGLFVHRDDIAALKATISQADEDMQVLHLADRAYRWLANRIAAQAVTTEPRRQPSIGPLRPLAHEAMPNSIVQAASELEAIIDRRCYSVQIDPFVRDLFSRTFVPQSLRTLSDHPAFLAARTRYEPARERMQSFAWFVSQLAPSREHELMEELLTWGDAAAFTGTSLRQLVLEYSKLVGRPAIALDKAERAAIDVSHARHVTAAFFLSRVYAKFFMLSLDSDDKASLASRWKPILERWHRFSPPQKLLLLSFALTAMVEGAAKGFESEDGETYHLSSETSLGVAADQLLAWSATEPSDLLANVTSEIAVALDKLAPEGPSMLRLAPLILFLRAASPGGRLSLTHPRVEPIAILSAFWGSKPLTNLDETVLFKTEDDKTESFTVWLEDVLADAVRATKEHRTGMTFTTNAAHFRYTLREGLTIEADVPTMAVLMRLEPDSRPGFARELGGNVGPSDGVIYDLLQRVIQAPADNTVLRALARRAVESPMRQIRVIPSLVAFLPDVFLKLHKSAANGQLRALLSEVSTTGDAVARFDANIESWVSRDDVLGLVAATARIPGGLGWTWAVNCVALERSADIKQAEYFIDHPDEAHFGELWWAIATTWLAAAQGTEAQRSEFQVKMEAVLTNAVHTPVRGQREADCMAVLRDVVQRIEPDRAAVVWMTYRLFGWWFLQVRNCPETIDDALRDLSSTGLGSRSAGSDDAADPRNWPPQYDVRLVAILSAMSECSERVRRWIDEKNLPAWKMTLSDACRQTLVDLADREIETEVLDSPTTMWVPPLRVAMTALSALWMNGGQFSELSPTARERWLSWLPLGEEDDMTRPHAVVQQVLWFATKDLDALSPIEAAMLVDRISKSTAASMKASPVAAVTVARALGKKLLPIDQAWDYVRGHVGDDRAEKVVALVFIDSVASAHAEQTGMYSAKILRVLGRDVDGTPLRDLVGRERLFDGEENLRAQILANLE